MGTCSLAATQSLTTTPINSIPRISAQPSYPLPVQLERPPGAPVTCKGLAEPQTVICNPAPGRGCTGNALVSVPGVGGGDEIWFNSGDGNYYITAGNDPVGPVFGVVTSGTSTPANTLTQLVPTLPPVPAVAGVHGAGTVHSIAASAAKQPCVRALAGEYPL